MGISDAAIGPETLPLAGVRVLDLTRVLAGPFCTMILADLGADVVKVEQPNGGDDARGYGPFLASGVSAYFASLNRGKRSIALDLRAEDGRRVLQRLAERADVLVENFRPGKLNKLGLSREFLLQTNSRLVCVSLSGFGNYGPDVDRPAYDIIIQALSGLMSITGDGPGRYVRAGASLSDILTGLYGVIAVLSGLRERDVRGHPTDADVSMLDCTVASLENALGRFSVTGVVPEPLGTRHPAITPFQAFETADQPIVIAAGNEDLWRKLCLALDLPELLSDGRFDSNQERTQNREYVEYHLTARLRLESRHHWMDVLGTAGVPAAPIRAMDGVLQDPTLAARGMLHEMRDARGNSFVTAGSPLRFNGVSPHVSNAAPELDEHAAAVLHDWLGEEQPKA